MPRAPAPAFQSGLCVVYKIPLSPRLIPEHFSPTVLKHSAMTGNCFPWYLTIMLTSPGTTHSSVLHRDTRFIPKKAIGGKGSYIFLEDGQKFLDSTGGAAVSCLGHGHEEVTKAVVDQLTQFSYCHSAFFGTQVAEDLANFLVDSTGGKLTKLFVVSSG